MARKLGKLMLINYQTPPSFSISAWGGRRLYESAYEKQVEGEVPPPNEDASHKPEEYWEPDPDTGVFIPADEAPVTCTTEETVLDEKAFFRPLEGVDPPPPESFTGEIPPVDPFAQDHHP